jgi:hypothetical protein
MVIGELFKGFDCRRGKLESQSVETKILSNLAMIGVSWLFVQVYILLFGLISIKPYLEIQSLKASAHLWLIFTLLFLTYF